MPPPFCLGAHYICTGRSRHRDATRRLDAVARDTLAYGRRSPSQYCTGALIRRLRQSILAPQFDSDSPSLVDVPAMRLWAALLGALGAVSAAMINSDGLGASAPVPPNPLDWEVNITAYGPADGNTVSQWPTASRRGKRPSSARRLTARQCGLCPTTPTDS